MQTNHAHYRGVNRDITNYERNQPAERGATASRLQATACADAGQPARGSQRAANCQGL